MHLVAIKKSVYEHYPFVATSLYDAFVKSKKIALEKLFNLRAVRYMTPFLMREIDDIWEVFGGDPWPYGVEPNRQTLEALVTYQQDSGLDRRAGQSRRSVRADLRVGMFTLTHNCFPGAAQQAQRVSTRSGALQTGTVTNSESVTIPDQRCTVSCCIASGKRI